MILADESGWGSVLGGVIVGLYNTDTKKHIAKLIAIKYFQGKLFKEKRYLDEAVKIVCNNLLKISKKKQKIQICRGYMFDHVRTLLTILKTDFESKEIGDPFQSILESEFHKHLVKLGVPAKSKGAHCLSFDDQINWLKEDPKRTKYAKTGWKSWTNKYKAVIYA